MTLPSADVAICGGGIVGLATARAIARNTGRTVAVFDKEDQVSAHQSGRNSGVIHSGVYYPPRSKKAEYVKTGRSELLEFCDEFAIPYEICGKVIVATTADEVDRLESIGTRAEQNGIDNRMVGTNELSEIEPNAQGLGALVVPSAGIINFGEVCRALANSVSESGSVHLNTAVLDVIEDGGGIKVVTNRGDASFGHFISCAGLQSDRVAKLTGADDPTEIIPFRGEYYDLTPSAGALINNLIYPVPDPRYPFLGVHLTRSIDGSRHVGPNALLSLAREGYRRSDMEMQDISALLNSRSFWKMAKLHWRSGVKELWRSLSRERFLRDARRLVPSLPDDCLRRAGSGIRAQALGANGELLDDFKIVQTPRTISVLNAPSPAATASFAIGRAIAQLYLTALESE